MELIRISEKRKELFERYERMADEVKHLRTIIQNELKFITPDDLKIFQNHCKTVKCLLDDLTIDTVNFILKETDLEES